MKIEFTFDLLDSAGIGDQLGAQFAHLYSLGTQCGWTYRHIRPVRFNRSSHLVMNPARNAVSISSATAGLLGLGGSEESERLNLLPTVHRLFQNARSTASRVYRKLAEDKNNPRLPSGNAAEDFSEISDFLGLDSSEEWSHEKLLVPLEKMLEGASTLDDVHDNVAKLITEKTRHSDASEDECRLLVWIQIDHSYHHHISQIETLLGMTWAEVLRFTGKHYLRGRLKENPKLAANTLQPIVAVHLRLGDSLYVDTPCGCLILHGSCHFSSVEDFVATVRAVDPGRSPWFDPYQLSFLIERELKQRRVPSECVYLVSDGFDAARLAIANIQPDENISTDLLIAAKRRVTDLEKQFHHAFQWISKNRLLLGECPAKTLEAVKLFTSADTIICNNGGFSNVLHNLYKSEDPHDSFIFLSRERIL